MGIQVLTSRGTESLYSKQNQGKNNNKKYNKTTKKAKAKYRVNMQYMFHDREFSVQKERTQAPQNGRPASLDQDGSFGSAQTVL